MTRLRILVEGQTEEQFVRQLLAPHLGALGVFAEATSIATKRVDGRRAHRGGHAGNYEFIRRDALLLLRADPGVTVTTMLDYYGLPHNFPGYATAQAPRDAPARALHLEDAFAADIQRAYQEVANRELAPARFVPNLIIHEYEGLLFSSPAEIQAVLFDADLQGALTAIAAAHASPEDINDSPETAPSKRLQRLYPRYDKARHGPQIASRIGLDAIRGGCRHFDGWLAKLEGLQAQGSGG